MPTFTILQPTDQPKLETFLAPRLESSLFLASNSRQAGLIDNGKQLEGTYSAAWQDGEIIGVVAHFWNERLIAQAPIPLIQPLCRLAVQASQRGILGFLGVSNQVNEMLRFMPANSPIQFDEEEILYQLALDALKMPASLQNETLIVRQATIHDHETLGIWRAEYNVEALNAPDNHTTRQSAYIRVGEAIEKGSLWVAEADGELMACSGFNAILPEIVQVGGVYTPPAKRSRGYGRSAVAGSLRDMQQQGATKAILFTGEGNLPARRAYSALGFSAIGDYRILQFCQPIQFGGV